MKFLAFCCTVALIMAMNNFSRAQLVWSGYTSSPYNNGTAPNNMTVTVTTNAVTMGDGTPKYSTSTSPNCYIAGGSLALYTGFFNSYAAATNSNVTVFIRFNTNYSGTCNRISFQIKDINSEESSATFCDVVEISAVDGANNAIAAASITTTLASNVTRATSGTTVRLVGHSNASETYSGGTPTSYTAGASCGTTTVTITPPTNEELKTVTIKYRPAYGTSSSNAYYTSGTHPAAQYISIGAITLTSNGTCTILPIALTSFNAAKEADHVALSWNTASELNNDYFTIERSADGVNIEEVMRVAGAGSSSTPHSYSVADRSPLPGVSYYRLKQTDFNGQFEYFDWISVEAPRSNEDFFVQQIAPNPSDGELKIYSFAKRPVEARIQICDQTGRVVYAQTETIAAGSTMTQHFIEMLNPGIYVLKVDVVKEGYSFVHKVVVE